VLVKAPRYHFRKRLVENVLKQPIQQGNKRLNFDLEVEMIKKYLLRI